MTDLVADIEAAALNPAHSLSALLRQCQVLAFRLNHEPLKAWVEHELNGYTDRESLPPYRASLGGIVKADLSGPFNASVRSLAVPHSLIPEAFREGIDRADFSQGVATLESLVESAKMSGDTRIITMFPAELAAATGIYEGYETISMWLEYPISTMVGILDQVRSRALTFALEIEAANPKAGEAQAGDEPPVPLARTDTIFNTTIYGGNVAVGPGATVNVTPGDLGSLLAYLEAQGVAADDRAELESALTEDENKLGPRVKAWLGGIVAKTMSFGSGTAQNAVGSLIAFAVLKYLNLA